MSGGLPRLSGRPLAPVGIFMFVFLCMTATALAQQKTQKPVKKGLVWDNRPSIVLGRDIHIDIRSKLQLDWRTFDPKINDPEDGKVFDFRSFRLGLKGEITNHFEYEIERKISKDWEAGDWKDVYLMWKTYNQFSVQGGRFKMPFGNEQMTGSTDLDFAYRSLASSTIAPSRDTGGMVFGRFWGRDLTYQFGVFHKDGDNGELKEPQFVEEGDDIPEPGPSYVGRVTGTPLRKLGVPRRLQSLRMGLAYSTAQVPEGLNSLRGKSVLGSATFFEPVYVKGRRQRLGTELEWTPASFAFKAEWMQSREERKQQSNRNEDLSDFVSTGWFVSGSYILTGESAGDTPDKPLFKGGIGMVEVGARYDTLRLTSAEHKGSAFTNPRSDNLVPNADRVWTVGVNWSPNRWSKLTGNAIHESFEDKKRTIASGVNSFWCGLFRLQVVF